MCEAPQAIGRAEPERRIELHAQRSCLKDLHRVIRDVVRRSPEREAAQDVVRDEQPRPLVIPHREPLLDPLKQIRIDFDCRVQGCDDIEVGGARCADCTRCRLRIVVDDNDGVEADPNLTLRPGVGQEATKPACQGIRRIEDTTLGKSSGANIGMRSGQRTLPYAGTAEPAPLSTATTHPLPAQASTVSTISMRLARCLTSSTFEVTSRAPCAWAVAAIIRSRLRAVALRPARDVAAANSP